MAIRIKVQRNYYLSEVTMELPTDLGVLDDLLKATKASGRIVSLYNQGGVLGVNVEQRTKIQEPAFWSARIRPAPNSVELAVVGAVDIQLRFEKIRVAAKAHVIPLPTA